MKLDHKLFFITMALLFLAPRLPAYILFPFSPLRSSLSFGIVGLVLWGLFRLKYLRRIPHDIGPWPKVLILFAVYSLLISLPSFKISSMFGATQYLIYTFLSVMLLGNYLSRAVEYGEIRTVIRILMIIAVIYAVGVIVSIWTGPIYPHQTLYIGRRWLGVSINEGVGFGVNQNSVAGVMIVFISAAVLLLRTSPFRRFILVCLLVLALMVTVSRAGILGLVAGMIFMFIPQILSWLMLRSLRARLLYSVALTSAFIVTMLFIILQINPDKKLSLMEGFGFGGTSIIHSENARIYLWLMGFKFWSESPIPQAIAGHGFRNSAIMSLEAWVTSHNFFLSVLGDFGLIGLFLFLLLYTGSLSTSMKLARRGKNVGLFGTWTMSSLFLLNMTENFFYGVEFIFLLVFIMVLVGNEQEKKGIIKEGKNVSKEVL